MLKNKEVSKIKEVIGIEDPMQSADIIVPQPENLEGFIKQGGSNTLEFKACMLAPTKLADSILSKEKVLERTTGSERTALE